MTRLWSHDDARVELGALALDALSSEERSGIMAHVATCEICRAELAAMHDAAASLAEVVPARPMDASRSAELRARLLERARVERGSRAVVPITSAKRASNALPWWLAAAASIALVATGGMLVNARGQRESLRVGFSSAAARVQELERDLVIRDQMIAALSGPDVKVVDLVAGKTREPMARMFWARSTNTWTMFAHNMPVPAAGRTYQLWLITRTGQKISAGTFEPSASGDAYVSAQYALDREALQMIAVTDEPDGGMPQPTGGMVVSGAATP